MMDLDYERYHAEGLNQDSMGFCTQIGKNLKAHIQATIELIRIVGSQPGIR